MIIAVSNRSEFEVFLRIQISEETNQNVISAICRLVDLGQEVLFGNGFALIRIQRPYDLFLLAPQKLVSFRSPALN